MASFGLATATKERTTRRSRPPSSTPLNPSLRSAARFHPKIALATVRAKSASVLVTTPPTVMTSVTVSGRPGTATVPMFAGVNVFSFSIWRDTASSS